MSVENREEFHRQFIWYTRSIQSEWMKKKSLDLTPFKKDPYLYGMITLNTKRISLTHPNDMMQHMQTMVSEAIQDEGE